ncbi:MAG: PBECR4 domain-containing protein [Clostridia bacterium]|nr:PBECR4 domain-containing protein [Clostridia bacterium]
MENITECAKLYQTLLNKDYIFTLENNIKIKLYFSADNFYHLMGLEKLIDIEQLKGKQATKIYKQILSGNINDSIIQKSKYYYIIENRIKYFEHITDLFDFISHIF